MASLQKKIAAINDLSGYGRCSLMVAIPVISYMRLQCCPVPTSILSNHTGFQDYFFDDYSNKLPEYISKWKKLDLKFDGIVSGFLGSEEQIGMVEDFIKQFSKEDTIVVVDPVMGDHGKIASTYTEAMCLEMRRLVSLADIVTPNVTEACHLTDTPYKEDGWRESQLLEMAEKLSQMGPEKVVISGIHMGSYLGNYLYQRDMGGKLLRNKRAGQERCGTGDLFAAIIASDAVNRVDFEVSVRKAADFIRKCMIKTAEMGIEEKNGVCFEEILHTLKI